MTLPLAPLIIFIIAIFFVVLSVLNEGRVVNITGTSWKYTVHFYYPPLLAVLLLLILSPTAGSFEGRDLWISGFAGNGQVFPYKTMVAFETLAFVCIALDMTGILAYIALRAIQAAGSSGRKLYFYFYILSSAFTICTSNDIVILTLTPIIFYTTKVAGISPYPMLFSEFFTANICSMVLVIGNPVNLIVANANGLDFAEYSKWMAAPAIVGTTVCCFLMYLLFRKDIDVTFNPPVLDPAACLKDKRGVAFHGFILFMTRVLLGVDNFMGAEAWHITTVAAFCSLIYNFAFWPWDIKKETESPKAEPESVELVEVPQSRKEQPSSMKDDSAPQTPVKNSEVSEVDLLAPKIDPVYIWQPSSSSVNPASPSGIGNDEFEKQDIDIRDSRKQKHPQNDIQGITTEEPTTKMSILNCPWGVMPFVYGMFTLVGGLKNAGWIDAFAGAILKVIPGDEGNSTHAIAIAAFLMTTISFVLCSIIDNQPASILLTQVLLSPVFDTLPKQVRTAGMLGVLEGANVGGCWSLMGALAGIMWSTLLRNKGITIGYVQFMKIGLRIMPLVTFIISLIIVFECM